MNKKILIGSVIAICILIGVSFTSVVGYRREVSDIQSSPLFNIRNSRAIDDESKDFTYDYIGSGNTINLLIPDREEKKLSIKEIIDKIQSMTDETFGKFLKSVIYEIHHNKELKGITETEVITTFYFLRKNPVVIISDYNFYGNGSTWLRGNDCYSYFVIGCVIGSIWTVIFLSIAFIIFILITQHVICSGYTKQC